VKSVDGVDLLQFGVPEAMWHLTVDGFTAVVTMDSHGNSLHADVDHSSFEKLKKFAGKVF
jgi:fumarate hydratase class I